MGSLKGKVKSNTFKIQTWHFKRVAKFLISQMNEKQQRNLSRVQPLNLAANDDAGTALAAERNRITTISLSRSLSLSLSLYLQM